MNSAIETDQDVLDLDFGIEGIDKMLEALQRPNVKFVALDEAALRELKTLLVCTRGVLVWHVEELESVKRQGE